MRDKSSKLLSVFLPTGILMLCTAILVAYLSPWRISMTDATMYLRMAQEIQKGHWHIDHWLRGAYTAPPLYPLIVAISEWFFTGFERAGTIVSIAASTLLVIPVFFLTRCFYRERVAWFIVPVTILNPYYLLYSSLPLTEALFTLIFLASIFVTYSALKSKIPWMWCAAGMLSGAAWMTRDVGIIIPFISICWVIADRWFNRQPVSNIIRNAALLILGILLIAGPLKMIMSLDLRNVSGLPAHSITRQLMMPDLRDDMEREWFLGRINQDGTGYAFVDDMKTPVSIGDVLRHSDFILKRVAINWTEIAKSIHLILGTVFLVFVFIGLVAAAFYWKGGGDGAAWAILFPGVYVILYILFYSLAGGFTGAIGPERYLVPLIPVLGVWAVGGICKICHLAEKVRLRHAGMIISFLCLGFILMSNKKGLINTKHTLAALKHKTELSELAGTEIKKRVIKRGPDNATIMARSPFVPWYAGADWVVLPYGEYQEILKFAKNRHVDILSVDRNTVALRPELSFLLDQGVNVPEMEKVFWISSKEDPEEYLLVLYKINYNNGDSGGAN
ncbi:MAG: hypothetical protein IT393_09275 [Nitrospirae bacterium]|nr:hypothetical protein [Nitrospirota bacterium]